MRPLMVAEMAGSQTSRTAPFVKDEICGEGTLKTAFTPLASINEKAVVPGLT